MRHGSKLVDLRGGVSEKALIRSVQWDAYGAHILHLDLNRVSLAEKVTVTVSLDLRGEAPGTKQGGMVDHHLFDVEIECPAGEIPERLLVNIKHLEVGDVITVAELELPPHVKMLTAPDTVVVSCQAQVPLEEELEAGEEEAVGSAEPEVIGRKAEDSEAASD